jgi:parallel beta-helix repeat protein
VIEEKMATFNVLDFGATADDLSDDSAAIQAAIDAAYELGGGIVYIPAGTFIISGNKADPSQGCVEVRSNVTLIGEGMGETILKLADNYDARINGLIRTPVSESASNVTIKNLTIDGNRQNNTDHQAGIITGVKANDDGKIHESITISNVEVMNCTGYGVNPHELTYDLVIEDCVSHGNGKDGFVADYVVGGIYRDNVAYDNDRHGINVQNSSNDILLENNIAYNNGNGATGGAGIVVQRSDVFPEGENTIPWVTNIQIVGGEYYGNSREGILVKLSDNIEISDAYVHDNMRQGIRIEGATNTIVRDSQIQDNSLEQIGAYDEINIRYRLDNVVDPPRTYQSSDTQIYNNVIVSNGTSRYGIREDLGNSTPENPSRTILYNNSISGTLSGEVYMPYYGATEGDDYFYGTTSGDVFAGLGGNDTYIVNHSGDMITEQANSGIDTVIASTNYTLGSNLENLQLSGSAIRGTGNDLNNVIIGNDAANKLEGLAGDDLLDGGSGADTMIGGDGNDTYYVDHISDVIIEKQNLGLGGYDTVYSSVSYTLAEQVEKIVLLASDHLNATGNNLNNELIGNNGDNILNGMGGADKMQGGIGNDTYYVDHTGDQVIEFAGQGIDTVITHMTYVLGNDIENLSLSGSAKVNGTGNAADNVLVGNNGSNILYGLDGNDTLEGGLGADRLFGGAGDDMFLLRKGEFEGDVLEDFNGRGTADGDRISFLGFSAAATLLKIGTDTYKVQDGAYSETFRIKTPAGASPLDVSDYTFGSFPEISVASKSALSSKPLMADVGHESFTVAAARGAENVDHNNDFRVVDDTIMLNTSVFTALSSDKLSQSNDMGASHAIDNDGTLRLGAQVGDLYYHEDSSAGVTAVQFSPIGAEPHLQFLVWEDFIA